MFNINGYQVRSKSDYLKNPRTKITTTIRSDYWESYKSMMDSVGMEYCKGIDIMLEMLSEDENRLDEFITRTRKY